MAAAVGCRTGCLQSVGAKMVEADQTRGEAYVVALESMTLSLAKTIIQKAAGAWIADRRTAEESKVKFSVPGDPKVRNAQLEAG